MNCEIRLGDIPKILATVCWGIFLPRSSIALSRVELPSTTPLVLLPSTGATTVIPVVATCGAGAGAGVDGAANVDARSASIRDFDIMDEADIVDTCWYLLKLTDTVPYRKQFVKSLGKFLWRD